MVGIVAYFVVGVKHSRRPPSRSAVGWRGAEVGIFLKIN